MASASGRPDLLRLRRVAGWPGVAGSPALPSCGTSAEAHSVDRRARPAGGTRLSLNDRQLSPSQLPAPPSPESPPRRMEEGRPSPARCGAFRFRDDAGRAGAAPRKGLSSAGLRSFDSYAEHVSDRLSRPWPRRPAPDGPQEGPQGRSIQQPSAAHRHTRRPRRADGRSERPRGPRPCRDRPRRDPGRPRHRAPCHLNQEATTHRQRTARKHQPAPATRGGRPDSRGQSGLASSRASSLRKARSGPLHPDMLAKLNGSMALGGLDSIYYRLKLVFR